MPPYAALINTFTHISLHALGQGTNWDGKGKLEENKVHLPGSETNRRAVT